MPPSRNRWMVKGRLHSTGRTSTIINRLLRMTRFRFWVVTFSGARRHGGQEVVQSFSRSACAGYARIAKPDGMHTATRAPPSIRVTSPSLIPIHCDACCA